MSELPRAVEDTLAIRVRYYRTKVIKQARRARSARHTSETDGRARVSRRGAEVSHAAIEYARRVARVRPRVTARSGEHRLPGGGRGTGSGTRISRGASPRVNAMEMRSNHRVCWALVASGEIRVVRGKGREGTWGMRRKRKKKRAKRRRDYGESSVRTQYLQ